MGKNEKTGLGRALVKHHNQMVQQTKEKGRFYKTHNKKGLISVTDVSDIDAVIEEAEEADRLFSADNPVPQLLVDEYVFFNLFFFLYLYCCLLFIFVMLIVILNWVFWI